ncbi:hypothetical protein [Microbulbifer sp.]|uniref:hypothetical protein n=1 Tax=Microbulbifer sp. TaxID=1908541 RepID=UPI003F3C7FAF
MPTYGDFEIALITVDIPEFKLEKSVMQLRRQIFTDMGIEFCLNTEVGVDISTSL